MASKQLPDFQQALTELIAKNSISSILPDWDQPNDGVIHLLASWFNELGFSIQIDDVPNSNDKLNLLAKIGSGEGGLLLAGHSDTVPFDESKWQTNPHKITYKDDKFYGLGSCDMKGFFAFILQVAKQIEPNKLKKPLYILASADEEITMAGARLLAKQQAIQPDVAIIGEPTSLKPIIGHKGHMSHRISISGKSGHSSQPALGVNAIEIMYQVIGKLLELQQTFIKNYHRAEFDVPYPTLNLGAIQGGDNANRICGHCHLDIDMRALPGISDLELEQQLADALLPISLAYPERIEIQPLHKHCSAFEQKPSELVKVAEQLSGNACCCVNYATEAPLIQQLGCETIVLGPGSIDQAHQPNEFLPANEIKQTLFILESLVKRYCYGEH